MTNHPKRRFTDRTDIRVLVGTMVLCTFFILGAISYSIVTTNSNLEDSITTMEDGIVCLLGRIAGTEGIQRPPAQEVARACAIFLQEQDGSTG